MRAEKMNCNSIHQQCSESLGLDPKKYIFQYHCLINSWMNDTIEVCALNQSVLGKYLHFFLFKKKIIFSNWTSNSSYDRYSLSQIPVVIIFAYFLQTNTYLKAKNMWNIVRKILIDIIFHMIPNLTYIDNDMKAHIKQFLKFIIKKYRLQSILSQYSF